MGRAAKLRAAQRLVASDEHRPDPAAPVLAGTIDARTQRVTIPRPANFWRALPARQVQCSLCYRQCVLAPGEAGWCRIRRNDGGTLRLTDHGVIGSAIPQVTHYHFWRQHSKMVWVAGVSCTSACSFCTSTSLALAPERLPWAYGGERRAGQDGGWSYHRAMLHPAAVVGLAETWGCSGVYFGANEPTLTWEWTYDAARLAKAAGLWTAMDSNGFTSPAAIRALSPFLDMAYIGIKGSADPVFYDKRMRAAGAVPHVLAALRAWHDSPTRLGISDTIAPPHWCDDAAATAQMKTLYSWIAAELGPLTPLELRGMIRPQVEYGETFAPLLPRGAGRDAVARFMDRLRLAEEVAAACGLQYAYTHESRTVCCHHCGGVLVGKIGWVAFDLNVGTDGRCGTCGGPTPIIGISSAEYDAIQRQEAAGLVGQVPPAA